MSWLDGTFGEELHGVLPPVWTMRYNVDYGLEAIRGQYIWAGTPKPHVVFPSADVQLASSAGVHSGPSYLAMHVAEML